MRKRKYFWLSEGKKSQWTKELVRKTNRWRIKKLSTKYTKTTKTNCVGAHTVNLQGRQIQEDPQDLGASMVTHKPRLQSENYLSKTIKKTKV